MQTDPQNACRLGGCCLHLLILLCRVLELLLGFVDLCVCWVSYLGMGCLIVIFFDFILFWVLLGFVSFHS